MPAKLPLSGSERYAISLLIKLFSEKTLTRINRKRQIPNYKTQINSNHQYQNTNSVENIIELEKTGISAVVMKSLFEEQIHYRASQTIMEGEYASLYPETEDYIRNYTAENDVNTYLRLIENTKNVGFMLGFRTDFNYLKNYDFGTYNGYNILPNSNSDNYHFTAGAEYSIPGQKIISGVEFTFSNARNQKQIANFSDPVEYNPVDRTPLQELFSTMQPCTICQ